MPPKVRQPSIKLQSFSCPHCGALADQSWHKLIAEPVVELDDENMTSTNIPDIPTQEYLEAIQRRISQGENQNDDQGEYFVTLVPRLKRILARKVFLEAIHEKEELQNVHISDCHSCEEIAIWIYDRVIYPAAQYDIEPNPDLPDDIKSDFNEARSIVDASPRGAAALLRLCIQKLCIHLGGKGKKLDDDIASLVAEGLDVHVQQALDIVRVVGNNAVHPGQIELKDDRATAANLFELLNMIAHDRITRPREIKAIYDKLPDSIRAAIDKRDSAKKK
jgi:hypothetical protein